MEFYIADSIVYEDSFQADSQQADNMYFTDLDTWEQHSYPHYNDSVNTQQQAEPYGYNQDVMTWTGQDCMDWAQGVCYGNGIDPTFVNINIFGSLRGDILMSYSQYDFCNLIDANHGSIFYREFNHLMERSGIAPSSPCPATNIECAPESDYQPAEDYQLTDLSMELPMDPMDMESIDNFAKLLDDPRQEFALEFDQFQDSDCEDHPLVIKEEDDQHSYIDSHLHEVPRSPGSDSNRSLSPEPPFVVGSDVLGKIKTTSRKRVRGPKNWEYLMRLLADGTHNPKVIRWEDESAFTFRIVQPAVVAQIWGQRSNKPNLTYDNFARGLRYHYTTGALKAVSERQLVYQCGPKAQKYLREMLQYQEVAR